MPAPARMEELVLHLRHALGQGYALVKTRPVWDSFRIWVERTEDGEQVAVDVPRAAMDQDQPETARELATAIRDTFAGRHDPAVNYARYQPRRVIKEKGKR